MNPNDPNRSFLIKKPLSCFSILHFAKSKTERVTRRVEKHLLRAPIPPFHPRDIRMLVSFVSAFEEKLARGEEEQVPHWMARGVVALTEQPTGNFLLDIRRYHELHPSRNRPTTFSSSSNIAVVAGWHRSCPRTSSQIPPYVFVRDDSSRDVSNLCSRSDYIGESGRSPATKTATATKDDGRHARLCRSRCLHRYFATTTRGRRDAEALIPCSSCNWIS